MEPNEWLVILNPVSGRGRALRHQGEIVRLLHQRRMRHSVAVSHFHGHTIELVSAAIAAGCRRLLVAGGDGSLSEAVNGILAQSEVAATDILLATLPVGTGNDWARSHQVPGDWPAAVALAASEASAVHDAGLAEFGDGNRRWFINVAGVGFDAAVVERKMARGFGPLAYVMGLLGALWSYQPLPVRVALDKGPPRDARIFVHFAALGKNCGGGMLIAPEAVPDEGRFHSVMINAMSRLEVLVNLKRLFDGTLHSHPKVEAGTCTTIHVAAPTALGVEADGELIGHTPVTFRVLPRAIRVVVPPVA